MRTSRSDCSADDAHELHFTPQHRHDLLTTRTGVSQLRDAHEHDVFLRGVLKDVDREVHIVSQWIVLDRVQQTGALDAMAAAVHRKVKVNVYTDLFSNTHHPNPEISGTKERSLREAVAALRAKRINTHVVRKVHSKIVIGDGHIYCVGSFNWFSAQRDPASARHEASLVYRGLDLVNEIEVVKKSLERRIVRWEQ